MSINMPKTIKEERLRWILPIYNKEVKLIDAAKVCAHSQRSLERWLTEYRKQGEAGLEPKSTRPKTNPKETPIRIKERVIEMRKETRKCAKKLSWYLEDEGIKIHFQTVQKFIKAEGLTRKYRVRKIQYKYLRVPLKKGELIEIDVKYVPDLIEGKRYYQFTAIDCATRWRYLSAHEDISTFSAIRFLEEVIAQAPFKIQAIKTDNGSCFTNRHNGGYVKSEALFPKDHAFDELCKKYSITHYLIDPGKPAQNGKVERSHRTDQEQFYDQINFKTFKEFKHKLRLWNREYNNTKHCGLNGKSPNEMLLLI